MFKNSQLKVNILDYTSETPKNRRRGGANSKAQSGRNSSTSLAGGSQTLVPYEEVDQEELKLRIKRLERKIMKNKDGQRRQKTEAKGVQEGQKEVNSIKDSSPNASQLPLQIQLTSERFRDRLRLTDQK